MWKDPIVEEVRALRDEYARKFEYDLDAISRDLQEQEARSERKLIDPPAHPNGRIDALAS